MSEARKFGYFSEGSFLQTRTDQREKHDEQQVFL
jgi:hypothetical protein